MDVGDGVIFCSHPEIAAKNAWSRKRVRDEIARCRALGITLLPKLNFSTIHDAWMGEYSKMVCTGTYYHVVNDLIREVYEIFEKPAYIHIGLDEEDAKHCTAKGLSIFRTGEQYWYDVRFYIDCVTATGAKPVAWSCPLFEDPEAYKAHIAPDEQILGYISAPWFSTPPENEPYFEETFRAMKDAWDAIYG